MDSQARQMKERSEVSGGKGEHGEGKGLETGKGEHGGNGKRGGKGQR
jgi:hypothetical protein